MIGETTPQSSSAAHSGPSATAPAGERYEDLLASDLGWAMSEGSLHFEGESRVQRTLTRIARRLDAIGVPYAVIDGMALFAHGVRRFTEDVDVLVTREGLRQIHQRLEGLGYVRPFAHSKHLRDTETKVKVEFVIAGEFPGDGLPKPVAFPDPACVAREMDGVKYVDLPTLLNLKLASGMTNPQRSRDLSDVEQLMDERDLDEAFAESIDPFVRPTYLEMCRQRRFPSRRFALPWSHPAFIRPVRSLEELIDLIAATDPPAASSLREMRAAGVTLDSARSSPDHYAYLVVGDRLVASRFEMPAEDELLLDDDESDDKS